MKYGSYVRPVVLSLTQSEPGRESFGLGHNPLFRSCLLTWSHTTHATVPRGPSHSVPSRKRSKSDFVYKQRQDILHLFPAPGTSYLSSTGGFSPLSHTPPYPYKFTNRLGCSTHVDLVPRIDSRRHTVRETVHRTHVVGWTRSPVGPLLHHNRGNSCFSRLRLSPVR